MRAVIALRRKIVGGEFEAGMRLLEVSVAETLDISRTPVREAMSRLVEEGLIDRLPNGGFAVRRFTYADASDAVELRGVLEGTAARLAAERGADPAALERMEAILDQLDEFLAGIEGSDFKKYAELNDAFHEELAGLSNSDLMRRELERIVSLPFAAPSSFLPDPRNIEAFRRSLDIAQVQHREIVSAIRNREGARAESLLKEHSRLARNNFDYVIGRSDFSLRDVPELFMLAEDDV